MHQLYDTTGIHLNVKSIRVFLSILIVVSATCAQKQTFKGFIHGPNDHGTVIASADVLNYHKYVS